jgi:hypothetical protein
VCSSDLLENSEKAGVPDRAIKTAGYRRNGTRPLTFSMGKEITAVI